MVADIIINRYVYIQTYYSNEKKEDKKINIYCFISCKLDQAYAELGMQLGNGSQERVQF